MGLAATQARFLGITARKSNIEYEGQQVNQQRTALAEEVNSLYNKLLALDVPVAPDTTDYYETNYSFEITNTTDEDGTYLIKNYYKNSDGTYTIHAERTYQQEGVVGKKYNYPITNSNGVYSILINNKSYTLQKKQDETIVGYIKNDYPNEKINEQDNNLYYYADDSGEFHYITPSAVENNATGDTTNNYYSIYTLAEKQKTEPKVFYNALLSFDENNRVKSINIGDDVNHDVNTTRVHNDEEYAAALRDYTMSKDEYDKAVADLNAQTESLQQEDKILELRLNQIDTEQSELQTELEAVKKVLEENIENTFKTFA